MEYAKKMVLLPRESLEKIEELKTREIKTVQTPGNASSRLDSEMWDILNTPKTEQSEKWKQFQQILLRYLKKPAESRDIAPIAVSNDGLAEQTGVAVTDTYDKEAVGEGDEIIASIPPSYHAKANLLLQKLKSADDSIISWDGNNAVSIHGTLIPRSNIIDLINDVMRVRKNVATVGNAQFAAILRELNIPRTYIGNPNYLVSPVKRRLSAPDFSFSEESAEDTPPHSSREIITRSRLQKGGKVKFNTASPKWSTLCLTRRRKFPKN